MTFSKQAVAMQQAQEAIANGDLPALNHLLSSPDASDLDMTALAKSAIQHNQLPILQECIKHGADVNEHHLAQSILNANSLQVYEIVVPAGYDITFDHAGNGMVGGPLCWAILKSNIPLISYLLSHGAALYERQARVLTPLSIAARKDSTEMINLLISHAESTDPAGAGSPPGSPTRLVDRSGALLVAAEHGNEAAARCLLDDHGANVNLHTVGETMLYILERQEETALHKAVAGGHLAVIELLLGRGVDAAIKSHKGQTPAELAREKWGEDSAIYQRFALASIQLAAS